MKYIIKTYDLFLIGISFVVFLFSTIINSIDYFFSNQFYEGFSILIPTIIFAIINMTILLLFTFRKNFKNFKVLVFFNLLVFFTGFLGFKIPLVLLPLILGFGIHYIVKEIKERIKEKSTIEKF